MTPIDPHASEIEREVLNLRRAAVAAVCALPVIVVLIDGFLAFGDKS